MTWWARYGRRLVAAVCVGGGLVTLVLLAWLGGSSAPIGSATSALIALIGAVLQLAGAGLFASTGRADPAFAQRATARLARLAVRAQRLCQVAEASFENQTSSKELRDMVGKLSVALSYQQEGLVEALEDWQAFHPYAVKMPANQAQKEKLTDD